MERLSFEVRFKAFLSRHLYEAFFDCEYVGPVWTGDLLFDLRVIEVMPVLYPEQIKESV
jgi:hypothetical protein